MDRSEPPEVVLARCDAVVIGAGVIGLAVARALSLRGREVVILEAEPASGLHTSSRNSEVIHAGIYYDPGSLKARLCVAGRHALYAYCEARGVAHARTGKVLVAVDAAEQPALEALARRARENGVSDLRWLERDELRQLEPEVEAARGLLSPGTGVIDSHGLMQALWSDAKSRGAELVLSTPVLCGVVRDGGIELQCGGANPGAVLARTVVNAAGLGAVAVARGLANVATPSVEGAYFARGRYFILEGRSPFSRLVYPLPVPGGLGIHVTLDLAGQARFGPDVSWVPAIDYTFEEDCKEAFVTAIRRYYPGLDARRLAPGYTGIRPKLEPATGRARDFVVQGPREHGVPGLVQLFGIESPGLTACLALADYACELLGVR